MEDRRLGRIHDLSTFLLEAWTLLERGKDVAGGIYVALSVFLCIGDVVAGRWIAHALCRV